MQLPNTYNLPKGMPYTRQEYIDRKLPTDIIDFNIGNPNQEFKYKYALISTKNQQIRDNAIEAARLTVIKTIEKAFIPSALIAKVNELRNTAKTLKNSSNKEDRQRYHKIQNEIKELKKQIDEEVKGKFFFKIYPYPHIKLRQKKVISTAGADRLSEGMRNAFGRVIDLAARVKRNQVIIELRANENEAILQEALTKAKSKLPNVKVVKLEN